MIYGSTEQASVDAETMPFEVGIVTIQMIWIRVHGNRQFFVKNKDKKYTITWFHCSKSLWLVAKWLCAECGPWRLQLGLSSASSLPYGAESHCGVQYWLTTWVLIIVSPTWNLRSSCFGESFVIKVIPLVGFGWHQLVTTADGRNVASACRQDAFVNPAVHNEIPINWARTLP